MFKHIVQFPNGMYGVRKFSFLYMQWAYLDFRNKEFWWPHSSRFIDDCMSSDLQKVKLYTESPKRIKV